MARSLNTDPLAGGDPFAGGGYFTGSGGGGTDGGTTFSGGSADPISGQFSKIRSIIGTPTGPSLPGLSTTGSPSYTAGPNSSDILRQGINLIGGQGVNLSNLGNTLLGTGIGTLQAPVDFYTKLLSGDPATVTSALAPTASNVEQLYQPAINNARMNMPRGGFGASTAAELPFTIANQVGNAALGLQPAAATALTDIGKLVAGLGTTEQGIGQTGMESTIQAALQKMGVPSTPGLGGILGDVGGIIGLVSSLI